MDRIGPCDSLYNRISVLLYPLVFLQARSSAFRRANQLPDLRFGSAADTDNPFMDPSDPQKEQSVLGDPCVDPVCGSDPLHFRRIQRPLRLLRMASGSRLSMAAYAEVRTSAGMHVVRLHISDP